MPMPYVNTVWNVEHRISDQQIGQPDITWLSVCVGPWKSHLSLELHTIKSVHLSGMEIRTWTKHTWKHTVSRYLALGSVCCNLSSNWDGWEGLPSGNTWCFWARGAAKHTWQCTPCPSLYHPSGQSWYQGTKTRSSSAFGSCTPNWNDPTPQFTHFSS